MLLVILNNIVAGLEYVSSSQIMFGNCPAMPCISTEDVPNLRLISGDL